MVEFGVSSVAPLAMFKGVEKKRLGAKPCIVFAGEGWEHDATLQRVRSLFLGALRCVALRCVRGSRRKINRPEGLSLTTVHHPRQTKTDFFRVEDAKSVALAGIDSVAIFTAMGDKAVLVRNYHLKFKKSGERVRVWFTFYGMFIKRR